MKKIIIYCRKSAKPKTSQEKKEENKILSLDSQEKELKNYALKKGFKIVKIFKENESAYKKGRPMFNEMIQMLEAGKADHLAVYTLSRISRNSYDGGNVIYLIDTNIIKSIITPTRNYVNNADDKFIMQIEFAMAKKSSDDTSCYVKRDLIGKAENGEFPGNAPPGYLNINKEGRIAGVKFDIQKQVMLEKIKKPLKRIETDPIVNSLITKLFEEAAKGIYSLNELCDKSFALGIRASRSGKKLVKSSLLRILTNPFYYGVFFWENKFYENNIKHDAIISKELFDKVQIALKRKSFHKIEKTHGKFAEIMNCGECHSTISFQERKGHIYYYCTAWNAKKKGKKCSHRKYYREEWIEEQFIKLLETISIPKPFIKWTINMLRKNYKKESDFQEKTRLAQQNALNNARKKRSNLFQLKISPNNQNGEMISDEEFLAQKSKIDKEIALMEEKIGDASQNETNWLNNCEEFFNFTNKLQDKFTHSSIDDKRMILKNIGKVVMNRGKMAFQLQKPYVFISKIKKIKYQSSSSYEPSQISIEQSKTHSFDSANSKWRNGRDLNPRPLP